MVKFPGKELPRFPICSHCVPDAHDFLFEQGFLNFVFSFLINRLCMPSPVHALAALGLLLTSMYTGILNTHKPNGDSTHQSESHHLESREPEQAVMAMERVSILFDR